MTICAGSAAKPVAEFSFEKVMGQNPMRGPLVT